MIYDAVIPLMVYILKKIHAYVHQDTCLRILRAGASLVAQWLRICLPMQGHGFKPWSGRIPHAAEQLGP